MNLPLKLVEYRQTNKLSQEDLAARLGVSRQSVSKWEQGLSFPETDKLIELSNMMGVSIDSLLKGDPEPSSSPSESISTHHTNWPTVILAILLAMACIALAFSLRQKDALPTEPSQTTETPTESTETIPDEPVLESDFHNQDLTELRDWFFDFARRWRLDYMPTFSLEDGAPSDAGEYLYWCSAINTDEQGSAMSEMSKEFVEETILLYFSTPVNQHRSHIKQWNYDPESEIYTAYPDSLKAQGFYKLNSIEIHGSNRFTVHGTRYYCNAYSISEEVTNNLKFALLESCDSPDALSVQCETSTYDLIPIADFSVTFHLDFIFHQPKFEAMTYTMLTDMIDW